MNILDRLLGEHETLRTQIKILQELRAGSKEEENAYVLKDMVVDVANMLEKHAYIEDQFFHPVFIECFQARIGDPALYRTYEQEDMRSIRQIVDRLILTFDAELIGFYAGEFIKEVMKHMEKEERVIFPLARDIIGKERLERLSIDIRLREKNERAQARSSHAEPVRALDFAGDGI